MCGIIAYLGNDEGGDGAAGRTVATLVDGLQRMEYRGYDSAGIATITCDVAGAGTLEVVKKKGRVVNLRGAVGGRPDLHNAGVGIAHTRWATHGPPSDVNSHPHMSNDCKLAVVHNGIIENYEELKLQLEGLGYSFKSATDTEVLTVLIRHTQLQDPTLALEAAVTLALAQVRGAYGIAVIDEAHPDLLVGARKGSPLILGMTADSLLLASDATAVVGVVDRVVYLEEEDVVSCTRVRKGFGPKSVSYEYSIGTMREDGFFPDEVAAAAKEAEEGEEAKEAETKEAETKESKSDSSSDASSSDSDGSHSDSEEKAQSTPRHGPGHAPRCSPRRKSQVVRSMRALLRSSSAPRVERASHALTMNIETIQKNGFEHFMLKEIMEQPKVLRESLRSRVDPATGDVSLPSLEPVMAKLLAARRIVICACGTSWHSGLVGEYLIETLARLPVEVEYASEFRYRNAVLFPEDVVVVLSQSGETADTLEAIRLAQLAGATTVGIVNVVGSSIARATDACMYLQVGPEIGVASTKAFTGQVLALTMLAVCLGARSGALTQPAARAYGKQILAIPDLVEQTLCEENLEKVKNIARTYRYARNFLYLGRGYNFPVALEGALKLKEISYVHAEGYPAAEMKHGPIALIDQMMPVVVIAPKNDATYEKVKSGIQEVAARQGSIIAITDVGNDDLEGVADFVVHVPVVSEFLTPILATIPLQLLSYHIANMRGCDIDNPRNLAKSVTVE